MLAGTAPIPANSGQVTTRYRLNRYGDRQLNNALHTVVQSRIQYQPATRDYVARRTAEGKTRREIKRCLTRYVARDLYRLLPRKRGHSCLTKHRCVALGRASRRFPDGPDGEPVGASHQMIDMSSRVIGRATEDDITASGRNRA